MHVSLQGCMRATPLFATTLDPCCSYAQAVGRLLRAEGSKPQERPPAAQRLPLHRPPPARPHCMRSYPALTRLLTLHGPASPAASAASDAAARMPPGCRLRARGARGGAHVAGRVTQQGPRAGGAQESPVLMPGLKHDSQLDPPPSAARRQARRPGRAPESAAQRARRGRPAAARRRSCGCRCRSRGGARRSAASDRAWARPTSPAGPCAAARPGARPKPGHGQSCPGTTAQSAACLCSRRMMAVSWLHSADRGFVGPLAAANAQAVLWPAGAWQPAGGLC